MIATLLLAIVVTGPFDCTPYALFDGDGPISCREFPHVRLSGIAARDALARLFGGQRGRLRSGHIVVRTPTMRRFGYGSMRGDRTAASCDLAGRGNLACAMMRTGTVARWRRYGGDQLCS